MRISSATRVICAMLMHTKRGRKITNDCLCASWIQNLILFFFKYLISTFKPFKEIVNMINIQVQLFIFVYDFLRGWSTHDFHSCHIICVPVPQLL